MPGKGPLNVLGCYIAWGLLPLFVAGNVLHTRRMMANNK